MMAISIALTMIVNLETKDYIKWDNKPDQN